MYYHDWMLFIHNVECHKTDNHDLILLYSDFKQSQSLE